MVAMLAEIFMMRLEAEARLVQEVLPASASGFIPFNPESQVVFKEADLEGDGGRKTRLACQTDLVTEAGRLSELMNGGQEGALSTPNALRYEAVPGRTVKRLAFRARCFARAGIPLALLNEVQWTKMSSVPSPRVRKPKPRSLLNHFTCARSRPLVGATVTWVRGGAICVG
jgi:hypothetical protein